MGHGENQGGVTSIVNDKFVKFFVRGKNETGNGPQTEASTIHAE